MPRLTDQSILKQIVEALTASESCDHVVWHESAQRELKRDAPRLSQRAVNRAMRELARAGKVDQARETRPEWMKSSDFHYDFRFPIAGYRVYVETILDVDAPSHPEIIVVSFHEDSKRTPKSTAT